MFLDVFTETATDGERLRPAGARFPPIAARSCSIRCFAPPYDYPVSHAGHLCDSGLRGSPATRRGRRPADAHLHAPPRACQRLCRYGHDPPHQRKTTFYALVKRHGNVRHILPGHVHRTISGSSRAFPSRSSKAPCTSSRCPSTGGRISFGGRAGGLRHSAGDRRRRARAYEDYEIARRDAVGA